MGVDLKMVRMMVRSSGRYGCLHSFPMVFPSFQTNLNFMWNVVSLMPSSTSPNKTTWDDLGGFKTSVPRHRSGCPAPRIVDAMPKGWRSRRIYGWSMEAMEPIPKMLQWFLATLKFVSTWDLLPTVAGFGCRGNRSLVSAICFRERRGFFSDFLPPANS